MDGLTIGDVAKQAKVDIETIRYYERRGLLERPPRSVSNYRLYHEDAVRRVRFIKRAQELGLALNDIRGLLSLRAAPGTGCGEIRAHAEANMKHINEKIESLIAMKRALSTLVAQCSGQGPLAECPILGSLDTTEAIR